MVRTGILVGSRQIQRVVRSIARQESRVSARRADSVPVNVTLVCGCLLGPFYWSLEISISQKKAAGASRIARSTNLWLCLGQSSGKDSSCKAASHAASASQPPDCCVHLFWSYASPTGVAEQLLHNNNTTTIAATRCKQGRLSKTG